ncbi:MAG TPA: pentapeptide repeat-containing protein [Pirellulales bacterium]|jgi:uncharacterized protein YjbI with pentapeptide repeats|nr:pentapeptide repeat-containing protein [Pirellulales bacterium]
MALEVDMIEPTLAAVRPRVIIPGTSGSFLLTDKVCERLDINPSGFVELMGPLGSGKTAAISHLAHVFKHETRLLLADEPDLITLFGAKLLDAAAKHLVICASPAARLARMPIEVWRLAPWTTDDCIEYVLAMHRNECDSVMRRILADADWGRLAGRAELCRVALDRLATDASLADVKTALRREVDDRLTDVTVRSAASLWCLAATCHPERGNRALVPIDMCDGISADACSLLRHPQTQILLAVEYVAKHLRSDQPLYLLEQKLPEPLVRGAAALLRDDERVRAKLQNVLASRKKTQHAMAASLLHSAHKDWIPEHGRAPNLSGAYLSGARWPGIRLAGLQLKRTDLSNADLSEARLQGVSATLAHLSGTRFHGAQLKRMSAGRASLVKADLSFVRAPDADFEKANLREANLEGALLQHASFVHADLRGARCCRADFSQANFELADLAEADFTGADLSQSNLQKLVLRVADFSGAQFAWAILYECDLEYMRLPGANFERALLRGALLTGSQMPDARFRGADLSNTGLADIEWERADLRDADLRGSTFHMGSSRSGLVGSPIASEGSRTGFYTDEYHEQDFKAPEEIRKANLCGADLRGAKIDNVDFYLVDLRGAVYSPDQEDVFRRCRAILETRV